MNIRFLYVCLIFSSLGYSASAQLKIACIGNSITQGKIGLKPDSTFEYSYRPWLWEQLIKTGFKIDMVGFHANFFGEKSGNLIMDFRSTGVSFDRDCEAYYGITSSGFVNGSESIGWTGAPLPDFRSRMNDPIKGYTADIALIHIGTNDPDSTAEQVELTRRNIIKIIEVLREKNPSVVVIVAKLITGWKKINFEIDGICSQLSRSNSPVVAVDMSTGFINHPEQTGSMTYDYVHPNKAGQLFMMQRWYDAIIKNLQDTMPPSLAGKLTYIHAGNDITVTWPAAIDNYGVHSYEISVDGNRVHEVDHTNTTFKFEDLKKNKTYKVSIKAKDWSGNQSGPMVLKVRG